MPFFWVDDQFHKHSKVDRVLDQGDAGIQAIGLWTLAGSLSQAQLSTGVIRESAAGRLIGSPRKAKKLARILVDAGLWEECTDDGAPAYRFHDWLAVQRRSGEAVKNERARRAELKNPEIIEAVKARDGDVCRYCAKTVRWGDNEGDRGGTFDHVDPHLVGGVSNIVVACRADNRTKAGRTPEQAQMKLLDQPVRPSVPPLATAGRAGAVEVPSENSENFAGTSHDQPQETGEKTGEILAGNVPIPVDGDRSISATDQGTLPTVSDHAHPPEDSSRTRTGATHPRAGAGQGNGPGSGTGEGEGEPQVGRAGLPPAGFVVPEHLRGGIGSPWANHHGPPPDVPQPQCQIHHQDLPCRRCHRQAYEDRAPPAGGKPGPTHSRRRRNR